MVSREIWQLIVWPVHEGMLVFLYSYFKLDSCVHFAGSARACRTAGRVQENTIVPVIRSLSPSSFFLDEIYVSSCVAQILFIP